jgi:integrase
MKRDLPKRVYERHGAWYFVDVSGKWHRLCAVRQGMPAMYRALADLTERETQSDRMPAVISRWLEGKRTEWAPKTLRDMERIAAYMSQELAEFTPAELKTPRCNAYLKEFIDKPRTYTQHRTMLRMVLSFAALDGLREGHNPIDDVPSRSAPPRKRIVADAEIEAIKRAALHTPNGRALVCMIDLALITGQRIGDLIRLTWADVGDHGVRITQAKTGERLLIEWSAALRAAVDACETKAGRVGPLLRTALGGAYTYDGISSLWKRTRAKLIKDMPGIRDLHIHDLRGRAGVDVLLAHGEDVRAAQRLLGHANESMTRHYVGGKYHRKAKPAR